MCRWLSLGWILFCWSAIGFAQPPVEMKVAPLLGQYAGSGGAFPIAVEVQSRTGNLQGEVVVSVVRDTQQREYRYPMELPANGRKRIVATPVVSDWGGRVSVRFQAGRIVVRQEIEAKSRFESQPLAVLVGDAIGGLQVFQRIEAPLSEAETQWGNTAKPTYQDAYVHPDLFPTESFALSGAQIIVLGQGAERLRAEQWRAIREWVLLGGILVVPGGSGSVVAQLPALRPLLPAGVGSVREIPSLSAIATFIANAPEPVEASVDFGSNPPMPRSSVVASSMPPGSPMTPQALPGVQVPASPPHSTTLAQEGGARRSGTATVPSPQGRALISTLTPKRNATMLLQQGGIPLIVGWRYGQGTIFLLAFNPLDEPMQSYTARRAFWEALLVRTERISPGALIRSVHEGHSGTDSGFGSSWRGGSPTFTNVRIKLPSPLLIFTLLAVYFVLVIPVNYFVLKRFRALDWAWLTTPLVALIFVGVIGWSTRELYRRPLSGEVRTQIIAQANEPEAYSINSVLFFFPRAGAFSLRFDESDMVEPGVDDYYRGTIGVQSVSTIEVEPRLIPNYAVRNLSFQWFRYTRRVKLGDGIEANLRIVNEGGKPKIKGTIRNRTPYTLNNLQVIPIATRADGERISNQQFLTGVPYLAEQLKPGQSQAVVYDLPSMPPANLRIITVRLNATSNEPVLLPELGAQADTFATVNFSINIPVEVSQ